ncbi:MAG TPA: hypothetical protein VI855_07750 [Dehalococcoidia bacterium]|nr:hypothetical protein [Dehalococcoidia bacterium]
MSPEELKVGTKVVVNGRNPSNQGRRGEVRYIAGSMYWLRFEDGATDTTGFNNWMLDPAPAAVGAGRGRR